MSGATVQVTCANKSCKLPFTARVADRKRGWGRFCSKNCKASEQTRRTGVSGPYMTGAARTGGDLLQLIERKERMITVDQDHFIPDIHDDGMDGHFSNEDHDCNKD